MKKYITPKPGPTPRPGKDDPATIYRTHPIKGKPKVDKPKRPVPKSEVGKSRTGLLKEFKRANASYRFRGYISDQIAKPRKTGGR